MNKTFFILFILGLLAMNNLQAQNNGFWEEIPGPYGGWVSKLTATSNGKLYAQMPRGDVYRSLDNGETWTNIDSLNLAKFEDYASLYIGKAGTAFLETSDTAYVWSRSENEGATWEMISSNYQFHQVIESSSGVLAGFANNQLFFSEDKGVTWIEAEAPSALPIWFSYTRQLQDGTIIAAQNTSSATMYRSTDEGRTWVEFQMTHSYELSFSPSGAVFEFSAFSPYIRRSPAMGEPFVPAAYDSVNIHNTLHFLNSSINDLTALPNGRLLKSENSCILYSDDDGLSWHKVEGYAFDGTYTETRLFPNCVLPDGRVFMDKDATGLYRSNDFGKNWVFSAQNIRCGNVLEMAFETDSIFYAVTPSGLWKTESKGQSWLQLTDPKITLSKPSSLAGWRYLHFDTPSQLFIGVDSNLLYSTNKGQSFDNVTPINAHIQTSQYRYPFIDPETKDLYMNGFRSSDSGAVWQASDHPYTMLRRPSGKLLGLRVDDEVILAKSVDNGVTWDLQDTIPGLTWAGRLNTAPDGTLYFVDVTNPGIMYRSEDEGQSWIKSATPPPTSSCGFVETTSLGHLILASQYNVYLSLNKGASWQTLPNAPERKLESGASLKGLALSPDQYVYAGYGYGRLYKSRSPISSGSYLRGSVRLDADADCSTDDATAPLKNWVVEADGDGDLTYTTSDSLGHYVMLLDTGLYNISLQTPNAIWWEACDSLKVFQADTLYSSDTLNFSAVAQSECPLMSVDVSAPVLRRCFDNNVYFQYCNLGSELADSAWVDVELDPYLNLQSCPLPYTPLGNNTFRVALGDVAQGDCGQFTMIVNVSCDSTIIGQTHCISTHAFPDTLCTTLPDWSGANIEAEVICQDSIIQLHIRNTGIAPSIMLDYIIFEDDVVLMTGQEAYDVSEDLVLDFAADGHTWRIESEQEPGHPFSTRAIAFAEGCGGFESLGFINQFSLNGIHPSVDVDCRENIGSYDPNDKQGFPLGTGLDHEIRPGQELEYMIRFQNTGTDTAFKVVVCDTLSALLDPATVRPGASSHPYTWELSGNGTATFSFANIALPDSNASQAGSQGFITFRVQQRASLPLGSVIYNSAGIFFDFNTPVITNQTWHTVALPTISTSTHSPGSADASFVLRISPNPASDFLFLESRAAAIREVEINSADGVLRTITHIGNPARQIQVALGDMPSGTYFARVFCGNEVVVKKFVLVR